MISLKKGFTIVICHVAIMTSIQLPKQKLFLATENVRVTMKSYGRIRKNLNVFVTDAVLCKYNISLIIIINESNFKYSLVKNKVENQYLIKFAFLRFVSFAISPCRVLYKTYILNNVRKTQKDSSTKWIPLKQKKARNHLILWIVIALRQYF